MVSFSLDPGLAVLEKELPGLAISILSNSSVRPEVVKGREQGEESEQRACFRRHEGMLAGECGTGWARVWGK